VAAGAERVAELLRQWAAHDSSLRPRTAWDLVSIEAVRADGRNVVVEFTSRQRPGCRFAYRTSADDDTQPPDLLAELIFVNLRELVEASDLGLPADCTPGELTWIDD
jgi:hypothetical protein